MPTLRMSPKRIQKAMTVIKKENQHNSSNMPKNDYYDVLGVSKDSDSATIKSSYRKLAIKYHPDESRQSRG